MPDTPAITFHELQKSRRIVAYESAEFWYVVTGTVDEKAVLAKLKADLPATYKFAAGDADFKAIVLQPPEIEPVFINEDKPEQCIWEARALYKYNSGSSTPPQDGESTYQFDTTGGTQHITQSRQTVWSSPNAPDFKSGIGWDGENFQGCDITMPVFKFSETHFVKNSKVTEAYKNKVCDLTGKVNNGTFKGRATGEVLFLGATGSLKDKNNRNPTPDDLWEISYSFAVSRNATNLEIGDITVPEKKGWDYLWTFYAPGVDDTAYRRIKTPKGVYVERVYEFVSFDGLILTV